MSLSRLVSLFVGVGLLAGGAWHFVFKSMPEDVAEHSLDSDRQREIVREVAKSFETMAAQGKPLPVPEPGHVVAPGADMQSWESYGAARGFGAYEAELVQRGGSGPEIQAVRKLLTLNHFGTEESPSLTHRFAAEAFEVARQNPGEALQAISQVLDGMPSERSEERSYLLQLASRLDEPGSPTHARVTALLREEAIRGGDAAASPASQASAAAAVLELIKMGEPLPDVTELASHDPILSEWLGSGAVSSAPPEVPSQ